MNCPVKVMNEKLRFFTIALLILLLENCFENNKSTETNSSFEEYAACNTLISENLESEILSIIKNEYKNYAVYIYDLNNGDEVKINSSEVFYPASICKIPYAVLILKDIDSGILNFNDTILLERATIAYSYDYMENTLPEHQDRIQEGLPEGVETAHKIGQLSFPEGMVYQDAGIIFGENTDYILVILNRAVNKNEAIEKITKISSIVYYIIN